MIAAALRFAGAVVPSTLATYWQMAPVGSAIRRRFASHVRERRTAGSGAADIAGRELVANGAHLHDELATGAGGWCGNSRGCCCGRGRRNASLNRARRGDRSAGCCRRRGDGGAAAGSLLSSTPLFSGVGAPRNPLPLTGAPTLSSGLSVELLMA